MNELERRFNVIKQNEADGYDILAVQDKLHSKDDVKLDRHLLIDTPYHTAAGECVYGFAIQPLRSTSSEPNTVELYAAPSKMGLPHNIDRYCPSPNHSLDMETVLYDSDNNALSAEQATSKIADVSKDTQYAEIVHEYSDWKEITEARFKKLKVDSGELGSTEYNAYLDKCLSNMHSRESLHHYINADATSLDSFRMSDPEIAREYDAAFGNEGMGF